MQAAAAEWEWARQLAEASSQTVTLVAALVANWPERTRIIARRTPAAVPERTT